MTSALVTAPMAWHGPELDQDERALLALVDEVALDSGTVLADDDTIARLTTQLADLGIWALGAPEALGGSGGTGQLTVVAWERLGRYWPALALASVQAQAALALMGADEEVGRRADEIASGRRTAAVVDRDAPHVTLNAEDGGLYGTVDRIDAASTTPALVVLDGTRALLVRPETCTFAPVDRTGLRGSHCASVRVEAQAEHLLPLPGDADRARTILRLGGAAIACGIAGAAADTAASYATQREQFGGPLIDIPTVRRAIADQIGWVRSSLAAVWGSVNTPSSAAAVLRSATDGAVDVTAAAVQSHGGYGYLTEYPVERHLRDAVSLRAAVAGFRGTPEEET